MVFLPPLLMDGAWFTAHASFRRHLVGILSLAIGAVLFTTAAVAVAAKLVLPSLPWAACVVLGAVVAPPDAVSARAILQRVKLPRRLGTLLEGESLLNDATGLVLVRFGVAAVLTGTFSLPSAVGSFFVLVVGGIAVGGAIGALWVALVRRLANEHLMIAASTYVLLDRLSGWREDSRVGRHRHRDDRSHLRLVPARRVWREHPNPRRRILAGHRLLAGGVGLHPHRVLASRRTSSRGRSQAS